MDKPPVRRDFDPQQRIEVDAAGSFVDLHRMAYSAADMWVFGPNGPYKRGMTKAEITHESIREALLHLLELGVIDVDEERLAEFSLHGYPAAREDCRG